MLRAMNDEGLTIRVLIDMISLEAGLGHISASLKLLPSLQKRYQKATIELVPLHESINPDCVGGAYSYSNISCYVGDPRLLNELDEGGFKQAGEKPIIKFLTTRGFEDESMMKQAIRMLHARVGGKTKIISLKSYLEMNKRKEQNVVVISGAFDKGTALASYLSAYENQYGSSYPLVIKQPVGWKKGINECSSLPPMPNFNIANFIKVSVVKKIIILYKTFDNKNRMQEQTKNALFRLNADAEAKNVEYDIHVFGVFPEEEYCGEFGKLKFIKRKSSLKYDEIFKLLKKSNLVITEGQNTAYEAAALGIPVFHFPKKDQADRISTVIKKNNKNLKTDVHDTFIDQTMDRGKCLDNIIDWISLRREAFDVQLAIKKAPKIDKEIIKNINFYIFPASIEKKTLQKTKNVAVSLVYPQVERLKGLRALFDEERRNYTPHTQLSWLFEIKRRELHVAYQDLKRDSPRLFNRYSSKYGRPEGL
jgi:hypothetical protein